MPLADLFGMLIPVTFLVFWALESRVNARPFRRVRGWTLVGLGFFLLLMTINITAPFWVGAGWQAKHRLMDLSGLGLWGVVPGVLTTSLVNYGFHRAEHRFTPLWRGLHQIHHSAERVDMLGSVFTHPLEMVVQAAYGTAIGVLVLGLDPAAAAITGYVAAFTAMFQHLNITTPRWVGWFIQRPEAHCLHHERGVHARNYGDIALWDMVFGTYHNPARFEGEVGFGRPAVADLPRMLAFADVNGSGAPDFPR